MESRSTNRRRMRVKLIFNPSSGAAGKSPVQLMDVISEMQAWKLVPEAYLVEPGCELSVVVQNPLEQGMHLFVVCGGDGTILAVAGALTGTRATQDHPHWHAEQRGPQPGYSGGYPGRHRNPAHGPAHPSGRGPGRLRQDCATLPPGLFGGAGFGCFPVGRRYPARQPGADR